ncbi:MAG: hypothetical protein R2991_02970 [Thermoanaerobaculia bacterium]
MTVLEPPASSAILALYYLVLGILAFYGLHRLILLGILWRRRGPEAPEPPEPADWPFVTVQLPLYNERCVASRLLEAACRLDYPRDRLEIQVLDDSTDETTGLIAQEVERWRGGGRRSAPARRPLRHGFRRGPWPPYAAARDV